MRLCLVFVALGMIFSSAEAQERWARYTNPGWAGRDGAGLLALGEYLYLLGGWAYHDPPRSDEYGALTSEVWRTSDLQTWTFLGNAPWPPRHGAAWLVHDERMWVIGGDLHADVWSSADGITWRLETVNAPFGPRYTPNAASLNGAILYYGGQWWDDDCWCTPRADSTVWRSEDGRNWERIAEAPWSPRALIHGSIVYDGSVYLIGGGVKAVTDEGGPAEAVEEFTGIWSSPDGRTWQRLGDVPFPPRTHFSVVAAPPGCFVSDGSVGRQADLSRDLFFAPNCQSFQSINVPDAVGPRHASSLAWFRDGLVLLGGPDVRAGSDVWHYKPSRL